MCVLLISVDAMLFCAGRSHTRTVKVRNLATVTVAAAPQVNGERKDRLLRGLTCALCLYVLAPSSRLGKVVVCLSRSTDEVFLGPSVSMGRT